ncbi:MAG: hypothetical protein JGK17_06265 [Microcoleus sp. PH2017_10_PVI_O_A]|uniref:hypothetical protein n=1 Tax=unclassified Microcoleus TaxID=2642155 RepID=UPI001DFB136B|nr:MULTISPECIES: hypothetical protein [unclassified Microcoleus]MCC3405191.1 hypothetical protein [Microcoleus sp. PH2017_10_PVI_O_A]MCC3459278.1 hypothetical protein [Microcoleus sp. PH2017_11_PCY_U_A]MCC3477407.1 hypothetical protein [Microcoleus sp. PH2017_12_PCY_D_A]MCC3558500.1 hypothetical protein [Microcoleus sp. PH2017_27_LUM_O_A]
MYELFFSDKARKLEQDPEKQSFCYFSIEETPDYFRHGHSKNHCRHRESETLIGKGCRKNVPKMGHFSRSRAICVVARFCWRLKSLKIQELTGV